MEYLKTKEEIFENIPEITAEDIQHLNRIFEPYLFVKEHREENRRECWCSVCNQHFFYDYLQRTETSEHYEFLSTKHNKLSRCPECGASVIVKETYRAKQCTNLDEWRQAVIVKPRSKNEVYLICVYANKDYRGRCYMPSVWYSVKTVYYLTPGSAKMYKTEYCYEYFGLKADGFYEPKTIFEPFPKTYSYNYSAADKRGYCFVNYEDLLNTFLRYAPLREFEKVYENWFYCTRYGLCEVPNVKFLAYSAMYPGIEMLVKTGLTDFVCSFIDRRPLKRYINWTGRNPQEMFGINNAQFKDMKNNCRDISIFMLYQTLKNTSKQMNFLKCCEIQDKYKIEAAQRIADTVKKHQLNLTHTLNYLDKKTKKQKDKLHQKQESERTAIMWCDYIRFASELKYDLSRKDSDIYFPKNLQEAHDNASRAVTVKKDEIAFEKYKKRYEKLQNLYEYSDGTYCIVIPQGINDIIDEGKILRHCVGGYAERHVSGITTILFMRKCSAPDERLVTIEIADGQKYIRQNYGYKDRHVTKEEQAFIDSWLAWVKAGSKRNKKKKAAKGAA
ncbi:MAG: PcfJ domain-containing protein [Oscillospiraceae bacterium]|nr:PcfJ domain-containing protein [Oscillospiraceae bacterium]